MNLTSICVGLETGMAYAIGPQLRKIHSTRPEFREPLDFFLANGFATLLQFTSGITISRLAIQAVPSLTYVGYGVILSNIGAMAFLLGGTLLGTISRANQIKYSLILQRINQVALLAFSLILTATSSTVLGLSCAASVIYGYQIENRKNHPKFNYLLTTSNAIVALGLFLHNSTTASRMALASAIAGFLHYKATFLIDFK